MPAIHLTPLLGIVLTLAAAETSAAEKVHVTIWEGLPEGKLWNPSAKGPDDSFEAPAMGFIRVPAKYSARGIDLDRPRPFAVRAEALVTLRPGRYRLVVRSRGLAR